MEKKIRIGIIFILISVLQFSAYPVFCTQQDSHREGGRFGIVFNTVKNPEFEERAFSRLQELGVQWVRLLFPWDKIEPNKGAYNEELLQKFDKYVKRLTSMNIKVIAFLPSGAVPKWAYWDEAVNDPQRNKATGKKAVWQVYPPRPAYMAQWVVFLIRRYKADIKDWIILNEVSSNRKYTSPQELIEILKAVYSRAKEEDPDCCIIMAAIGKSGWPDYYEDFFSQGGAQYVDMVDRHMYWHLSRIMNEMPALHTMMNRFHISLPVEIGEMADPSHYEAQKKEPEKAKGSFDYPYGTPDAQAQLIVKRMSLALAYGVGRIIASNIRDDASEESDDELGLEDDDTSGVKEKTSRKLKDHYKGRKPGWKIESGYVGTKGILDDEYNPKPAFYAYQAIIQKLTRAHFERSLGLGQFLECHVFRNQDRFVMISWAWGKGEKNTEVTFSTGSPEILVSNKLGKVIQRMNPQDGKIRLRLTSDPVFIEGTGTITIVNDADKYTEEK